MQVYCYCSRASLHVGHAMSIYTLGATEMHSSQETLSALLEELEHARCGRGRGGGGGGREGGRAGDVLKERENEEGQG